METASNQRCNVDRISSTPAQMLQIGRDGISCVTRAKALSIFLL
jgi:hypothetical protein